MTKANVVAIDGPSGSGKSTIAKDLSNKLGLIHIDTGSMFRSLAFLFLQTEQEINEANLNEFLKSVELKYRPRPNVLIEAGGVVLDEFIRQEEVGVAASNISKYPCIRNFLLDFQRSLVSPEKLCVMEGRDIGSVVFPNAKFKFFITADAEVRALRRSLQLEDKTGQKQDYEQILADVMKRDKQDQEREIAPLKACDDAKIIDSSNLSYEQVLDQLVTTVKEGLA